MRTQAKMEGAAARKVGRDFEARHTLSFEQGAMMGGSMEGQKEQTGEAHTPSLEDMLHAVAYIVDKASAVAARSAPRLKRLPSESSSSSSAEEEEEEESSSSSSAEEESSSSSSAEEEEEVEEGEIIEEVPSAVVVWQC